ncbi:MAG: hypothetical protein II994_05535 [Lachnospiraceae bacterium]|nr:hypothetical protein [Lachnospiraceae bacterium]
MDKLLKGILLFVANFTGMVLSDIVFLCVLFAYNEFPLGLKIPLYIKGALACLGIHAGVDVLVYKKFFRGKFHKIVYMLICVSPYVLLLWGFVYWLATFPFL